MSTPNQLPVPSGDLTVSQTAAATPLIQPNWSVVQAPAEFQSADTVVPFSHYLWVLRRHRWKILGFILVCILTSVIVSSRLTPIYESTAIIDIDRQAPSGVIGQDSTRPALTDTEQFLATQIKLIQTDAVLRPVAQKYKLVHYEEASRQARDRYHGDPTSAPILLKNLKVSRPPNTYILQISYRSPDPQLAADVANAIAQSYVEHTYNIRFRSSAGLSAFMEKQLEELRAKMEKSSAALANFERELNVVNPEEKTSILTSRLLQLNSEYTNAQADRVKKEAAAKSVQSGTLEAAQISSQGESIRRLTEQLDEAQAAFADVKSHYGVNHPLYKKALLQVTERQRLLDKAQQNASKRVSVEYEEALNREQMIYSEFDKSKKEFDQLNARSFEYKALKQEAEADKGLYEELIRKIKEAGINASFQDSSIRLADVARPTTNPVFPNIRLNILIALICATLLAVGVAILSDQLDSTIRDPEHVKRYLGTEAIGSLPLIRAWRRSGESILFSSGPTTANNSNALAKSDRHVSRYEEAIRTIRDSILLADVEQRPKTLLLSSALPNEGKTTTSLHLAIAHASQKRRTLLIDADLRRPSIHGRLGIPNDIGLSSVLNDERDWKTVLAHPEQLPYLDIMPAGPASRRAADRLGMVLGPILEEASRIYDLILIDTPPLMGFAEPLQLATLVDSVVIVTLAGQTDRKAVWSTLSALKRLHVKVIGLILNETHSEISDGYYYYYGYYSKYSKYYKQYHAV